MSKYIIALDQGTTSSRAIVFNKNSEIVATSQNEFEQIYPKPGWVEQNPIAIYSSQLGALTEVVAAADITGKDVAAIGITNQRETTIMWNKKTGKPVYNAIVWQCRRTAEECSKLEEDEEFSKYVRDNTGLRIDAYFSATKIKWILDNVEGARELAENGDLLFGTVDTWLIWKMTDGKLHITDRTNASRTMLYNINTCEWDDKIIDRLGIPKSILPEVRLSSEVYGEINVGGDTIPIAGVAGDQQAALYGQTCFDKGDMKNTYGTGCFLLMNTGDEKISSSNGLITTIAASNSEKVSYALEGSVFIGGAVVQWLRDEMRFISAVEDSSYFAEKIPDNGGVYLVPAFTGLGAPYWDMYARGGIVGLTRGTTRNHIIRAALEGIAYQVSDLIEAIKMDVSFSLRELKVDGGASNNNFLLQFQSDILGIPIERPVTTESTALGAAYLAGLAVGFWKDEEEIKSSHIIERTFYPDMNDEEKNTLINEWHRAVGRMCDWIEH